MGNATTTTKNMGDKRQILSIGLKVLRTCTCTGTRNIIIHFTVLCDLHFAYSTVGAAAQRLPLKNAKFGHNKLET